MQSITRKTFTLDASDIREALADYINKHNHERDDVDVETMTVSFDHGTLDERREFPTITVTDGDC